MPVRVITGAVGVITGRFRAAVGDFAPTNTARSRALDRGALHLLRVLPEEIRERSPKIDPAGIDEIVSRIVRAYNALGEPLHRERWSLRGEVKARLSGWFKDAKRAKVRREHNLAAYSQHLAEKLRRFGDPSAEYEVAEFATVIHLSLLKLPDGQREILMLSMEGTATSAEIGQALGFAEKTINNNIWRARKRLFGFLSSYDDGVYRDLLHRFRGTNK